MEPGVISGQEPAETAFRLLDGGIEYEKAAYDGSSVPAGGAVARVRGNLGAVLSAERVALNFLQHLSGIATVTAELAARAKESGVVLLDTRKTTPGLRLLEKRAVLHGGGVNHRMDLEGGILIKENHLTAVGGLGVLLDRLDRRTLLSAEIEVSSMEELKLLRRSPPGRVMLDNFEPEILERALMEIKSWGGRAPEIEVSGGIDVSNIEDYARPGVDFVSVGRITSSAPALDMSLSVESVER